MSGRDRRILRFSLSGSLKGPRWGNGRSRRNKHNSPLKIRRNSSFCQTNGRSWTFPEKCSLSAPAAAVLHGWQSVATRPNDRLYGHLASFARNDVLLARCSHVLAVWDGPSRDTAYVLCRASELACRWLCISRIRKKRASRGRSSLCMCLLQPHAGCLGRSQVIVRCQPQRPYLPLKNSRPRLSISSLS